MQLREFALQYLEARPRVGKRGRLDDLAFIGLEHTEITTLTPDVNADHISEAGGIDLAKMVCRMNSYRSLPL
jgi:hypothetical protein